MNTDNLTILKNLAPSPLRLALDGFLLDRQAMHCTPKTLEAYRYALGSFSSFLISPITPNTLSKLSISP